MKQKLSERLQEMSDGGDFGSMLEDIPPRVRELEKERDELDAQVEVKDTALRDIASLTQDHGLYWWQITARRALYISGPAALLEIQARTLEEAAKRKGE